jgi:glucose-6-phosphate isomerase
MSEGPGWPGVTVINAGDVRITARSAIRDAAQRVLGRLWIDEVPVRLASDDPTLWGLPVGTARCWPAAPGATRALLPQFDAMAERVRSAGLTDVVLIGRGAPAVAADVFARHAKAPLTVLDGIDPAPTLRLGEDPERLRRTAFVATSDDSVANAHVDLLGRLLHDLGLDEDVAERLFVVTEDGDDGDDDRVLVSPRSTVFGALSPYGLLPAALAGADLRETLDQAAAVLPSLTRPENNPGLVLGAILAGCARISRNKVIVAGAGSRFDGLGDWVARLLADATGCPRQGSPFGGGLTPVVQDGGLPLSPANDMFLVALDGRPHQDDATVTGSLGAQIVVWEYATAVAAYLMGADPFADSCADPAVVRPPDHDEAALGEPRFHDRDIVGYAENVDDLRDAAGVFDALLRAIPGDGHLAILAYLDEARFRGQGQAVRRLAAALAARSGRPVTVRWDPDPPTRDMAVEKGVYLVLTGNVKDDEPVLDEGGRLSRLQLAYALSTIGALREQGRPVARLHLRDRWTGSVQLLDAAQGGRA